MDDYVIIDMNDLLSDDNTDNDNNHLGLCINVRNWLFGPSIEYELPIITLLVVKDFHLIKYDDFNSLGETLLKSFPNMIVIIPCLYEYNTATHYFPISWKISDMDKEKNLILTSYSKIFGCKIDDLKIIDIIRITCRLLKLAILANVYLDVYNAIMKILVILPEIKEKVIEIVLEFILTKKINVSMNLDDYIHLFAMYDNNEFDNLIQIYMKIFTKDYFITHLMTNESYWALKKYSISNVMLTVHILRKIKKYDSEEIISEEYIKNIDDLSSACKYLGIIIKS
jgi:hypothetical protein